MLLSFPLNLLIAIPLALLYCFTFYKADFLGNYRKKLFRYALFIQAGFLIFYSSFSLFLMKDQSNTGIDLFGSGLALIYIAMIVPFIIILSRLVFIKLKAAQQSAGFTYLIFFFYLVFAAFISIFGLYAFMFLFYGFAP